MIKRFDFCSFHGQGSMENDPEGIYCLHDDYEAMEARAIAAEAKLAAIIPSGNLSEGVTADLILSAIGGKHV